MTNIWSLIKWKEGAVKKVDCVTVGLIIGKFFFTWLDLMFVIALKVHSFY